MPVVFFRALGCASLILLALPAALRGSVGAPPDTASTPAAERVDPRRTGAVVGTVLDAVTGAPVVGAQVRVRELGRSELSHADGAFHFDRLPAGTFTLTAQRIGYAPTEREVSVPEGDTARLTLRLVPSSIATEGIVVTGTGRERGSEEAYRPTTVLGGAELRRELGATVAATLADEPGISQRYNGPAAAQPVIRGLGGDRVLVLEDGSRTGDIASTSADHAVTVDPITAERIEVVRGPAALLYGSSALGGVVNVIREEVPRTLPEGVTGTASAQVESVNRGATGGISVLAPVGDRVAVRGEASGRVAGDTHTPLGVLPSSGLEGYNAGLGASWVGERGFAGVALRDLAMEYGVPGEFNGVVIPGAHEGGVTIDLHRTAARLESALLTGAGPFRSVELDASYVRFLQDEIEPGGVVGSRFGQLTGTANLSVHHEHRVEDLFTEGAFGFWALGKDFRAAGGSTGTRPARQYSLAGFVFEELEWQRFQLQAGARYDWSRIVPLDTRGGQLGNVRTRDFGAFSGSLSALYELHPGWSLGASVARAFRTPSIEELFSDGPHLADFSFNIGNPELESEFGVGTDVFVRVSRPGIQAEVTAFRNAIDNYIFYAPTGRLDPRFRRFPVFQARGADALLYGAEGGLQWEALDRVVVEGRASWVRGRLRESGEPLPAIPPLHGGVGVRYDTPRWFAELGWEGAAGQDRLAPNETATPAYGLWSAGAGLRWTGWGRFQTLTLQLDNLTDEVWRHHLSRIKDVAPQPGRNVQLLYRVNF